MISNGFVIAILTGAALEVPYVWYARRARHRQRIFGVGLVVAAFLYVLFAAAGAAMEGFAIEAGGVLLFGVVSWLGARWSPYVLAVGWAGHVAWDLLLHPVSASSYAPWWYPLVCIGFDLFVAGAIAGGACVVRWVR